MDIERLREFAELSRQLNFTRAARTLHISQPTLSAHIRGLEKEVGAILVERSSGSATRLTAAGQMFFSMAVQTVELHDATVARIREVQRSVKGKIRVRAPRHEFSDPLLGYIMEFQKEYPNIEVVVLPWIEESAIRDITAGKVECAYAGQGFRPEGGETPVRGVCQVPFARAEVSLCLHESNALAKKDRVSLGDLDGCKISIPANQKNDTWVATVQSFADENGIAISFNEKYCDSLEDFVVNRLGSEDLFIARRGLLKLQAFKYRPDIVILPFDPMLYMRCEMAYADNDDPALRLFVGFLRDKYHRETEAARLEGGGPDER